MSIFSVIKKVNLWKTLYFNFRYLPFTKAIHLPVYIYWRSDLSKMRGKLIIDAPVTAGMIKFGVHSLGHQDSFSIGPSGMSGALLSLKGRQG